MAQDARWERIAPEAAVHAPLLVQCAGLGNQGKRR